MINAFRKQKPPDYAVAGSFASFAFAMSAADQRQSHWQSTYSSKGEQEVSWFQTTPQPSLDLVEKLASPSASPVIDIGGGASTLVDHLVARGFEDVTILDLSAVALSKAKARIGAASAKVHWLVADAVNWTPLRRYAVWHDRAAFHFLTEEADRAAYMRRLDQALLPGGHAIVATFAMDGPERCSGLPVVRYDAASLQRTLGPTYEMMRTLRHDHVTPGGKIQAFQFTVFRR